MQTIKKCRTCGNSYAGDIADHAQSADHKAIVAFLRTWCRRSSYDISWCDEHGSDMSQEESYCETFKAVAK